MGTNGNEYIHLIRNTQEEKEFEEFLSVDDFRVTIKKMNIEQNKITITLCSEAFSNESVNTLVKMQQQGELVCAIQTVQKKSH